MSKNRITRRKMLKSAGLITAAGLLSSCGDTGTPDNPEKSTSILKNRFEWKLVTTWPKNFPGLVLEPKELQTV